MAPLMDVDQDLGEDDYSVRYSAGDDVMVIAGAMAAFTVVLSMMLIVFICGCCGGEAQQKGKPEAAPEQAEQKSAKKAPDVKLVHEEKSEKETEIPFQVRKAPPPKHKVPLAPPGATVPPVYAPDDDPTVNVEKKNVSTTSGRKM